MRALFGQTSAREQTFLSPVVAGAVAWPVLLMGVAIPKTAALLLAFVPLSQRIPSWIVRIVWLSLAVLVPLAVGSALAAAALEHPRRESDRARGLAEPARAAR